MIKLDRRLVVTVSVYIYWTSLRVHSQLLVGKELRERSSVLIDMNWEEFFESMVAWSKHCS